MIFTCKMRWLCLHLVGLSAMSSVLCLWQLVAVIVWLVRALRGEWTSWASPAAWDLKQNHGRNSVLQWALLKALLVPRLALWYWIQYLPFWGHSFLEKEGAQCVQPLPSWFSDSWALCWEVLHWLSGCRYKQMVPGLDDITERRHQMPLPTGTFQIYRLIKMQVSQLKRCAWPWISWLSLPSSFAPEAPQEGSWMQEALDHVFLDRSISGWGAASHLAVLGPGKGSDANAKCAGGFL